jgi:hypothetical protein
MTALEALLNVLPYPSQVGRGKADEGASPALTEGAR